MRAGAFMGIDAHRERSPGPLPMNRGTRPAERVGRGERSLTGVTPLGWNPAQVEVIDRPEFAWLRTG